MKDSVILQNVNNMNGIADQLLYFLVPAAILLGAFFLAVFIYTGLRGQWDDLETPAIRILEDNNNNKGDSNERA